VNAKILKLDDETHEILPETMPFTFLGPTYDKRSHFCNKCDLEQGVSGSAEQPAAAAGPSNNLNGGQ